MNEKLIKYWIDLFWEENKLYELETKRINGNQTKITINTYQPHLV